MSVRILLWSPLDDYLAELLGGLPGVSFRRVGSVAEFADALPAADAIVMLGHFYTAEIASLVQTHGPRLRWIQLTTAGYDGISFHGVRAGVTVTNAGASHAPMVAEHAVTLLTALIRRLPAFAAPQARHVFDRGIGLELATLEDATVAILGYGSIGRETARRVAAFGARILGIARSARADDIAASVHPTADLHAVLGQADALVVAAALTVETRGMVDAAALAAMKPGGVLVNVARGGIVDSGALIAALRSGHLAGAGLDVTDPEPPPTADPLWNCPNLIVTPHVSGIGSRAVQRRIAAVVRHNVACFQAGQALEHVVA
jgi:phosphoglycerate dehydrogenase-like enzyme